MAAACGGPGGTPRGPTTGPAGPRVDAVAPPPAAPGRVDLRFTGAFDHAVAGPGVGPSDVAGEFDIPSADVEDADVEWYLTGHDVDAEGPGPVIVQLSAGQRHFIWGPDGVRDGEEFRVDGAEIHLDMDLREVTGPGVVHVAGAVVVARAVSTPVPDAIVQLLTQESGTTARAFATHDFGRREDPACGSVVVPLAEARPLVLRLRARLGRGWIAFVGTTRWLGETRLEGVEVVVGPGGSSLDALRLARTNAVNYGMGTEALLRRLARWDERLGIDVWQAETDTISFELRTLPADLAAFAEEVNAFCPDLVEQGVGSVEALGRDVAAHRGLTLWWD